MKMIFMFFVLLYVLICRLSGSYAQIIIPCGDVNGTWTLAGSPYLVQGTIQIPNGQTLTIEPGVIVNFQGNYKLNVQGSLLAIGTPVDTITFNVTNTSVGWQGIKFENTQATNDTSKLIYCKIQYCKTSRALYFNSFSKAIVSNCRISNSDGGISCYSNSNPIITKNIISYNTASLDGGGIYCELSSPVITNNIISFNTTSRDGGGICSTYKNPIIINNFISNNSASKKGGGIYCYTSNSSITNNLITNNNASDYGGGIYFNSSSSIITNNTISNNYASKGGGLYCRDNSNPTFRNCILWGNIASISGAQVFLLTENSDPNFFYCNVQGSKTAFELNSNFYTGVYQNNINSDPQFVYPPVGIGTGFNGFIADWSLQGNSPCINVGDTGDTYPANDIVGNPRVIGGCIDIGAYEHMVTLNNNKLQVKKIGDVITKKNGEEINVKVIEITTNEIKFKKLYNPTGQTYILVKKDVFMIEYENGTKDVFANEQKTSNSNHDNIHTNAQTGDSTIIIQKRKYYQNGQIISFNKVKSILQNNPLSTSEFKKYKTNANVGSTLLIIGSSLILVGATINLKQANALQNGNSGLGIEIVGLAFEIIGLPFLFSANKHLKTSVNLYNSNFKSASYRSIQYDLMFGSNGVGIRMRF